MLQRIFYSLSNKTPTRLHMISGRTRRCIMSGKPCDDIRCMLQ